MTNYEALLFIGKCLTLGHYPEKADSVRDQLRTGMVDWEQVVWVSTSHLVFPALYLNLQRGGLLSDLPPDLVEYMEEFTSRNRVRNHNIIKQALEVSTLLKDHNIIPVFLKGTAHLLDGLYIDIAERMMCDIDFLVADKDMLNAIEVLQNDGYKPESSCDIKLLKIHKHYPRMMRDDLPAGIEIHHEILHHPACNFLTNVDLIRNARKLTSHSQPYVLSEPHQILHNMLHAQMDHSGYFFAHLSLRQFYDLFLLSQKVDPLKVIRSFEKYFHQLNANLAVASLILDDPDCLHWKKTWQSTCYIRRIRMNITHRWWARISYLVLYLMFRLTNNIKQMLRAIYDPDVRRFIGTRLGDRKWYRTHWESYRDAFRGHNR